MAPSHQEATPSPSVQPEWSLSYCGVKGDWKWTAELVGVQSYNSCCVCLDCNASSRDVPLYTDVADNPKWVQSIKVPVLDTPLSEVRGWHPSSLFPDLLHCLWLGIARDVVASALIDLIIHCPLYRECDQWDARLHDVWVEFLAWAKVAKLSHTVDRLDMNILSIDAPTVDFPEYRGKGYDTKVLVAGS